MRAIVFPGQGSQVIGMGRAFADAFTEARDVLAEVDEALSQNLSRLMFDGPEETLTLTENAQPAIMACSMAILRVLERQGGFSVRTQCAFAAGHSLGEYTALCATGALNLTDTARLLKLRGQSMQAAVAAGIGGMAAILGLDVEDVREVASRAAGECDVCSVANDNAPGQVVLSGHLKPLERALELAKEYGARKSVMLAVSAPFHCRLMMPAVDPMRRALDATAFATPSVPIIANVTAEIAQEPDVLRALLVDQITGMVRWRESVAFLQEQGVTETLEIGAGRVLSGLIKRCARDMHIASISEPQDIDAFLNHLSAAA